MLQRVSAALLCTVFLCATSLFAGSTGTAALHTPQGANAGTANGDYVSDTNGTALNTFYRYFIEVPAGMTKFEVELFDADVGLGGAGEANAGRDRDRGGYDLTATYRLFDPAGNAVNTRFTTGNTTTPVGADNAWLDFYNATGNTVRDQFGTNAYTNNNGTANWATNWVENDGGGGGATGGAIQVTGGQLRVGDNVAGTPDIYREADLLGTPGLNMGMAYLTFSFTNSGNLEAGDSVSVQISNNGGGAYTTLETFAGNVAGTRSYDITGFIANNTRVRFLVAGGLAANEFFFFDNVQIADGPVTAGHWELQVDVSAGGDDINAIGIRAHDGDATSAGTELNVYADSMLSLGVNPDGSGSNTRSYTLYPWVTSGCTITQNDFDRDHAAGRDIGSVTYTSRLGSFTQTFNSASLSGDNVWMPNNVTGYTSNQFVNDYGIWTYGSTINTYINTSGNYETMYIGNYLAAAPPPTANPITSGGFPAVSRIYLPTDGGGAPAKPFLEQYLTAFNGPQAAPALGVPQTYTVTVVVVNPTPYPITFSATNLVIANVPGSGTVYAGSPTTSQGGPPISQPAIGGTGNITWNPGTVAGGSVAIPGTALLAYNITVTPASANTAATGTPGSGNGTRATYVDETGNTTQARATYRLGGLCNLNVAVAALTEVALASFEINERGRVSWITASEAGTVGFNLYREDGSKVNQNIIPAGRRHYQVDDRTVAQRYFLEEITSSGRVNRHGPLVTGRRLGPDIEKKKADPPQRGGKSVDAAKTAAVMVSVRETGIVRVPFSELATRFGRSESQLENLASKGNLSVTMGGATVAYTSTPDALLFFGEKSDSIYSRDRIYRVSLDKGERMANVAVGAAAGALSTFTGVADFETDAFPATVLPLDPESDYWFWDYVVSGDPSFGRKTFAIDVPALAGTSGASLEVRLQGALNHSSHRANVIVNGVPIGEIAWSDLNARRATLNVPAEVLQEGANQIEIEGVLDGGAFDIFYVDGFTLRYNRYARPVNGALEATIKSAVTAGPFNATPIALDITKRTRPALLTGATLNGSDVAMTLPAATKSVFLAEQFVTPVAYRSSAEASFKNQRADYIVVAPSSLRSGADALASLRQREGLRTLVTDLDQIYDEFSNGTPTPHAIRSYIASLVKSSQKPQYIVLAGTGNVDYRGLTQSPGPVPPMMIRTNDGLFASDSKIADANNNGAPDVAIGRIPISTDAELLAYVSKLQDHSTSDATDPIVFSADATDNGTDFGRASDESAAPLAPRPRVRLHIDEVGPQATRNGLLNAWQSGTPLVSWIGHGGLDQIGSSGVVTAGDAPSLLSSGRLPVMVAMTCTINRFEDGTVEPLGAALTRQPDAGALAVWSATGLSNHENARELQRTFMRIAAAKPQLRIGDLIVQTLAVHPSDTAGIYVLLGDPAVTMQLPKEMTNGGTPSPSGE